MADNEILQEAELDERNWEAMKRDIERTKSAIVLDRLTADEERLLETIARTADKAKAATPNRPPSYTMVERVTTSIATNTKEAAPGFHQELENEVAAVGIDDLLQLLTPSSDPAWDAYSDEERDAIRQLRDSQEVEQVLREQRYLEQQGKLEDGLPPIEERIKAWIQGGHAKKTVEYGTYALMAGMVVVAPPVAASMAASMALKRTVLPMAAEASKKLQAATEKYMVERGYLTPEQIEYGRNRLDAITKKVTDSKFGRFSLALGSLAVIGATTTLGLDLAHGDELGTRIGNLWESSKGLFVDAPEATELADLAAADAGLTELAHPDGGIDRDALAERFAEAGHDDIAEQIRGIEAEQLDEAALKSIAITQNPAAALLSSEQLVSRVSHSLGVNLEGVLDAARSEITADLHSSPATDELSADHDATTLNDPAQPESAGADAAGAEADTGAQVASTADVAGVEAGTETDTEAQVEAPAETPAPTVVTHEVVVGDTLSEAIYDAYRAEGVKLSAADLYGPSEYSDHPRGIVGELAEKNGFSNPDRIFPGDKINIEILSPHAPVAPGVTAAPPQVSDEAIQAAFEVRGLETSSAHQTLDLTQSGITPEAFQSAVDIASGGETSSSRPSIDLSESGITEQAFQGAMEVAGSSEESTNARPHDGVFPAEAGAATGMKKHLLTVAGALGLTAAAVAAKNLFSNKEKSKEKAIGNLLPGPEAREPAVINLTKAPEPPTPEAKDDTVKVETTPHRKKESVPNIHDGQLVAVPGPGVHSFRNRAQKPKPNPNPATTQAKENSSQEMQHNAPDRNETKVANVSDTTFTM